MGNEMSSHKKKGRKGKVENGDLNGHAVNVSSNDLNETVTTTEVTVDQTSQSPTLPATTNADPSPVVEATNASETDGEVQEQSKEQSIDKTVAEQTNDAVCITEESKSPGGNKTNFFDKLFNKKSDTKPVEVDVITQSEQVISADQVDAEEVTNNLQSAAKENSSKTGNFEVIEILSPELLTTEVINECECPDSISDFEVLPLAEAESGQQSNILEAGPYQNDSVKDEENVKLDAPRNPENGNEMDAAVDTTEVLTQPENCHEPLSLDTVVEEPSIVHPTTELELGKLIQPLTGSETATTETSLQETVSELITALDSSPVTSDELQVIEPVSPKLSKRTPEEELHAEDPNDVGQTEVQSELQPEGTAEPEILPEAIYVTPEDEAKSDSGIQHAEDTSAQEAQEQELNNSKIALEDESVVSEAGNCNLPNGVPHICAENGVVGIIEVQHEAQLEGTIEIDISQEVIDLAPQAEAKTDPEIHPSEGTLDQEGTIDTSPQEEQDQELIDDQIGAEDKNFASSEKAVVKEAENPTFLETISQEKLSAEESNVRLTKIQPEYTIGSNVLPEEPDSAKQKEAEEDAKIQPSEDSTAQDASEDTSAQEEQDLSHTKIDTEEESFAPSEKFEVSEYHPITTGVINDELLTDGDDIQKSESSDYTVEETTGELITPVTQTETFVSPVELERSASSADFEALQPEDTQDPEVQLKDLKHLDLSIPTGNTESETASSELGNHEDFTELETEEGSVDFEVIPMSEAVSGHLSDFSEVGKGETIDENDSLNGEGNAEIKSCAPVNEFLMPADESEVTEADSPNLAEGISEEGLNAEDSSDVGQTDVQSESQPVTVKQDLSQEAVDVTPQEEAKSDSEIHCSEDTVVQDTLESSAQEELIENKIDNDKLFAPSEKPVATEDGHTIAIKEITEEVMGNSEDLQDSESPDLEESYTTEETEAQADNVECEGSTSPGYLNVSQNEVTLDMLNSEDSAAAKGTQEHAEIQSLVNTQSEIPQTSGDASELTELGITKLVFEEDVEEAYKPDLISNVLAQDEVLSVCEESCTNLSVHVNSPLDVIAGNKGDTDTKDGSTTQSEALNNKTDVSSAMLQISMGKMEDSQHELTEVVKVQLDVPEEIAIMNHRSSAVEESSEDGRAPMIKGTKEENTSPPGVSAEESTQLLIKLQTACTKILEDLSMFSIQSINLKISARQSPVQLMIDFCLCTNDVAKCGNDTSKTSKQNDESQKRDEEGQIPV